MDEKKLNEIDARANAAIAGPWKCGPCHNAILHDAGLWVDYVDISAERNAEFIAHAREDIPALIAEVRHLREVLAGNQRTMDELCAHICALEGDE